MMPVCMNHLYLLRAKESMADRYLYQKQNSSISNNQIWGLGVIIYIKKQNRTSLKILPPDSLKL
ncbi:MAG TPA: hypothetical protein VFG45_08055 [Candidatus Nitrosocosmicus sp.]|nr:hypothetical protein [Candidatus Nitrosocosmicus sp.]